MTTTNATTTDARCPDCGAPTETYSYVSGGSLTEYAAVCDRCATTGAVTGTRRRAGR